MERRTRKEIRLKDHDYAQPGYYFVTICTKHHECIFWDVGTTCGRPLSWAGEIVQNEIAKITTVYPQTVSVDKFVVMSNHVHPILIIHAPQDGRAQLVPTLSRVIQQWKGSISKQIGTSIWQPRFHDHVIRNEADYLNIWNYIDTNPLKWELDCYYNKGDFL